MQDEDNQIRGRVFAGLEPCSQLVKIPDGAHMGRDTYVTAPSCPEAVRTRITFSIDRLG